MLRVRPLVAGLWVGARVSLREPSEERSGEDQSATTELSRGAPPGSSLFSDLPLSTTPALGNSSSRRCVRVHETPPPAGAHFWELPTRRSRCRTPRNSRLPGRVIFRKVRLSTRVSELRVCGAASRLTSCWGALRQAGDTPLLVSNRALRCYSRRPG